MSKQTIQLGTAPTGVGGDTPRSAFQKAQSNFDELYARDAQLGTAANANIGTAAGNVMPVGAGGWLGASVIDTSANNQRATGLYSFYNSAALPHSLVQMFSSDWGQDSRNQCQLIMGVATSRLWYRTITKDQLGYSAPVEFYSTGNTTRAADGTLKAI